MTHKKDRCRVAEPARSPARPLCRVGLYPFLPSELDEPSEAETPTGPRAQCAGAVALGAGRPALPILSATASCRRKLHQEAFPCACGRRNHRLFVGPFQSSRSPRELAFGVLCSSLPPSPMSLGSGSL